jgi:L-fucose mutarotase
MLKTIDPLLSPDLLHALAAMGHGDTIALVDANFPAASTARRLILLPGTEVACVLRAVLTLLPLDRFVANPAQIMQVVGDPAARPEIFGAFERCLNAVEGPPAEAIERFAFYAASAEAYAIVQTGERRLYGNIILRKGVIE